MNKDSWNRTVVFFEKMFRDLVKWLSDFYRYKALPYIKKLINFSKKYFGLVTENIKEDNEELAGSILESFKGLEYYRKSLINWIEIKFYERRNKKIVKEISKTTAPEKIPSSFSIFLKNVFYHIKFLSYRRLIVYSLVFITLDIFLLWFGTYRILYAKHYWEGTQDKKFFVRPGKNLNEIIEDLNQNDVLKSKFIFKVYVKISGKEDKIISKRYIFNNGISNSELLNILTDRNMVQTEKFTLIEGLRIKQIARIAETKLQLSQEKFIEETENDSLINLLGLKGKVKNLEGFLFPDTYYLPLDVDEKELVNILFNEFRKKVLNDDMIMKDMKEKRKSLLEVIVLASIIQGETNLKDEMGTISGVYHNRLKKRMRLEADPTIQYVLPDGPKPKLKYSDLKIDSPYNTYRYFGLPPGPINNPGLYAIKASINPEVNNFLFFVATGNGGHNFSGTYEEHLKAVQEYKKNTEKKSE
ncbi:MAG: endolytic transglycosylase MltG [Ignavibacteria bacterium]|jgi:UPF0755 protein